MANAKKATSQKQRLETYPTSKIVKAIHEAHGVLSVAAKKVGCHVTVIYRRQDDPEIAAAIHEAREAFVDEAETALYELVKQREPAAVFFTLKTRGKARGYIERQEVTNDGTYTVRVIHGDLDTDGLADD